MISFKDAYNIALSNASIVGTEHVDINDALNRVLAGDIIADLNMPPFDKSAMDGYACRKADLTGELKIIEEIPAGYVPHKNIEQGECSKIMTGAMLPSGADCVIIVEETEKISENTIRFTGNLEKSETGKLLPLEWRRGNSNICFTGEDIEEGDILLTEGTLIKPEHLAVLATAGCVKPLVALKPKIGIIATGSELVEPYETLATSQIRNTNSYQLIGQVKTSCAIPKYYGIAVDTEKVIYEIINRAMDENDVVIISGGVSMGDYDFVPKCLKDNGVKILFDRVAIQPGKPVTFGVSDRAACFGMPGNPVSAFIQYELLVRPFLYKMMRMDFKPVIFPLALAEDVKRTKTARESIIPVELKDGQVFPVEYHGSAHINAMTGTNYVISIPVGVSEIAEGTIVNVRQI